MVCVSAGKMRDIINLPALRAGFFFCMQKKNHRKKRQQIKRVLNEILFHPLTRECVNVTSFPYSKKHTILYVSQTDPDTTGKQA
ncbi:hypothetical protein CA696_028965 (plasmid) [Escherichia coli]|nr:hypothetical protein CA696_028965 [Escherichia coli]EFN8393115.1 hypothetical protein [Escherichia coli]